MRGKIPGIGVARKERREEKSPGEGEKENLRGKTPAIGAARKESREEKSPGEGEKGSLRGKTTAIGATWKESRKENPPEKRAPPEKVKKSFSGEAWNKKTSSKWKIHICQVEILEILGIRQQDLGSAVLNPVKPSFIPFPKEFLGSCKSGIAHGSGDRKDCSGE